MRKMVFLLSMLIISVLVLSSGCIGSSNQSNSNTTTNQMTHSFTTTTRVETQTTTTTQTQSNTPNTHNKTVTKLLLSNRYESVYYIGSNEELMEYPWKISSYSLKIGDRYLTIVEFHNLPRSVSPEVMEGVSGYTSAFIGSQNYGNGHLTIIFKNWMSKGKLMNIAFRLYINHKFEGFIAIVPKSVININNEVYGELNSLEVMTPGPVDENSTVRFEFSVSGRVINTNTPLPEGFSVGLSQNTNIPVLNLDKNSKINLSSDGRVNIQATGGVIAKYILSSKGKPLEVHGKLYYNKMEITGFTVKINGFFDTILKKVKIKTNTSNTSVQVIGYSAYAIQQHISIDKELMKNINSMDITQDALNNILIVSFKFKINSDSNENMYVEFRDSKDRILYSRIIPVVKGVNYASLKFVADKSNDDIVKVIVSRQDLNTGDVEKVFSKQFKLSITGTKKFNGELTISQDGNTITINYDGSREKGNVIQLDDVLKELDNAVKLSGTKISDMIISQSSNNTVTYNIVLFIDTNDARYHVDSISDMLEILSTKKVVDIGYYDYLTNKEYKYNVVNINTNAVNQVKSMIQDKIIENTHSSMLGMVTSTNASVSMIGFVMIQGYPDNSTVNFVVKDKNNMEFTRFMGSGIITLKHITDKASLSIEITKSASQNVEVVVFLSGSGCFSDYLFSLESTVSIIKPINFISAKIIQVNTNNTEELQSSDIPSGDYYIGHYYSNTTPKEGFYLIDLTQHYGITSKNNIPDVLGGGDIVSVIKSKDGHILVEVDEYSNSSTLKDNQGNVINLTKLPKLNLIDMSLNKIGNKEYEIHVNKVYFNNTHLMITVDMKSDYNGLQHMIIEYNGKKLTLQDPELETYTYMGVPLPIYGIKLKDGDDIKITITDSEITDITIMPIIITDNSSFSEKMDELMSMSYSDNNSGIMENIILSAVYEFKYSP